MLNRRAAFVSSSLCLSTPQIGSTTANRELHARRIEVTAKEIDPLVHELRPTGALQATVLPAPGLQAQVSEAEGKPERNAGCQRRRLRLWQGCLSACAFGEAPSRQAPFVARDAVRPAGARRHPDGEDATRG